MEEQKPKKPRQTATAKKDEEIAQLKEMLAQQQAMIEQLMSSQTQVAKVAEEPKEEKRTRVNKGTVVDRGMTKQGLRRKYRNTDIYVQSAIVGTVCYVGKSDTYEWNTKGEVVAMTIDDVIGMPETFLRSPWLVLDDYENDEEVLDDIVSCLGLEDIYRKLYILTDLDEDINSVDMREFERLVAESKSEGGTLAFDATAIVQNKIDKGELDSNSKIEEFEKILGRSFNKQELQLLIGGSESMGFEDVIDMMLTLLDDYQIADISDEELQLEVGIKVNMIIARAQLPDLVFDTDFNEFNRDLSVLEASILSYGLLMMWLSPFINNREVLQTQLTSKEVTTFSNANRIQQGIQLYKMAKTEFYQLVISYDSLQIKAQIKEQLEGNI